MAQEKSIGSAIPRGVVDTKTGTVGVPNQKTMEEEVRWLRDQVNALKDTLADLGVPSGRAVVSSVKDTGRRAGEMAREHPAWTALALVGLVGLILASTSRPYWSTRRSSRTEDVISDIEDRLSELKERYWSSGWRPW
ncbi:hypothetical protein N181_02520 [Sinorhizobium fredii USDA 205]|uniref:DUF3618 domain-containing protein n=1 Tax=Rhizobium fredii TaxID=380 RepID=A0A844ABN8_RHIFR|nr:hypothetical protein [Sinorhizobium fredii]ASY72945.1 hypothetical protein SF83666_b62960 [Sinorhizobium fredii CCBAU 83666]AWM29087.1 hypothetical protein AOX55_00006312 [Sinorhizobium fredii CCBAU 25509]KSV85885.1 hypothetical protein N181_02520 [Sinorhizobium fredii USDA 205]MCG5474900.1 hypothetical protein [Sinorhizobium fredii]MQX09478.1 hypothetical protein [Sinorhizobium fredii]